VVLNPRVDRGLLRRAWPYSPVPYQSNVRRASGSSNHYGLRQRAHTAIDPRVAPFEDCLGLFDRIFDAPAVDRVRIKVAEDQPVATKQPAHRAALHLVHDHDEIRRHHLLWSQDAGTVR